MLAVFVKSNGRTFVAAATTPIVVVTSAVDVAADGPSSVYAVDPNAMIPARNIVVMKKGAAIGNVRMPGSVPRNRAVIVAIHATMPALPGIPVARPSAATAPASAVPRAVNSVAVVSKSASSWTVI